MSFETIDEKSCHIRWKSFFFSVGLGETGSQSGSFGTSTSLLVSELVIHHLLVKILRIEYFADRPLFFHQNHFDILIFRKSLYDLSRLL